MIDYLAQIKLIGLTALFNPAFLFLLILLFFLGRLVGWMTRSINIWKFLALAYFGIFLFRPLQDLGLVIGGIFILGVASMYTDLFREIFSWSGNLGDAFSAFRYRGAYADIRRLEREIEELKSQLRASQMNAAAATGSSQQASWRAQSQARKSSSTTSSSSGGRGDGSSQQSGRSTQSGRSSSPNSSRQSSGRGTKRRGSSSKNNASYKQQSRVSDGPDGGQRTSQKQSSKRSKPNGTERTRTTGSPSGQSQSGQKRQSSAQSQHGRQSPGGQQSSGNQQQGASQSQSGASGSSTFTMSPALRDKYLQTLELTPGQSYTAPEIKAAWRKMAFKTHPDKGGSSAAFSAVQEAYKGLT